MKTLHDFAEGPSRKSDFLLMASIRDRIKALEASESNSTPAKSVPNIRNRYEHNNCTTPDEKKTSGSSTADGKLPGVAQARQKFLNTPVKDNQQDVGKIAGRYEEREKLGLGNRDGVESAKKRIEQSNVSRGDGRVGQMAGRMNSEHGSKTVDKLTGTFNEGNEPAGAMKIASVFQNREKSEKQAGSSAGQKHLEFVSSSRKEKQSATSVHDRDRSMDTNPVHNTNKPQVANTVMHERFNKFETSNTSPSQTSSNNVVYRASEQQKSTRAQLRNLGATSESSEKDIRTELSEVKRVNAELVASLVRLTAAFKEVEASRDDLGKRLRDLQSRVD